jgi:hypothetical protein
MGDRSFILGDRSSETTKGDRSFLLKRLQLVESSHSLVFVARGDRLSFNSTYTIGQDTGKGEQL